VDTANELSQFLTSRRAKVAPEQAGLRSYGRRQVPGLRREPFRNWWAAHNVRYHQTGRKRLHHPTVGDLELDYEVMQLSADTGLLLAIFSVEPGSRSADALDLLASWAAAPEPARPG
jgi:hypothetical protein